MTEQLDDCPFCGGETIIHDNGLYAEIKHKSTCFLRRNLDWIAKETFEAWNTRANPCPECGNNFNTCGECENERA